MRIAEAAAGRQTARGAAERRPTVSAVQDGTRPEPPGGPDDELVAGALRGDERASTLLVRRYLRKALAVALELAPAREDAEDLVQDAFRSAFANLRQFDRRRPFGPWFFTILRNAARNAAASRRLRSHEPLREEHAAARATPFDDAHRRELRGAIEAAIERLPAAQRTCFRLCAIEGLTSVEAAGATGLAESTVRVHVFKARRTLQALLERWREEAGGG